MMVKRVAGALGAELRAINLGDGIDAELAATLPVSYTHLTLPTKA